MQLLIIKINELSENPEYALLGKKQLQDRYTPGDWKRVRSLSKGRKALVLLPSNDVVLTSVVIPSKNRKQLLQAVPYALEDKLADDIENLHFSVHQDSNKTDNRSHVAIIDRTVLIKVLDLLKSNGVTASYILPQVLAQKIDNDSWSITYENKDNEVTANVRLGNFNAFVCDDNLLSMFLSEHIEKGVPSNLFTNTKPENLPEALRDTSTSYVETDTVDYHSAISALPLNLLTNFVRKDQGSSINWSAWKLAAILGGLLASIWMGIFFWQNIQLQNQSQQLNAQIEKIYKDTFPKGRLVDATAQMSAALNELKASAGKVVDSPLPLISKISPLLNEYKDLTLDNVRYQENQLTMTIESPNLTRLETFKKAAEKNNLKIVIKDSTTTANKVKAVIIISPLPNTAANQSSSSNSSQENS